MGTLIDGYNLLHASGLLPTDVSPKQLERGRRALLRFLASALDERERRVTTVVFDAKSARAGLPSEQQHRGITVRYSVGFQDADTLIEELIRANSSPRRLTVVSSDHRIQRAARRRRAAAVDSADWHRTLCQQARAANLAAESGHGQKPLPPNTPAEVAHWLAEFGDVPGTNASPDGSQPAAPPPPDAPTTGTNLRHTRNLDQANPFPPGYAEDLLHGDEDY